MTPDEWLTLCLMAIHNTTITLLLSYAKHLPSSSSSSSSDQLLEGSLLVCVVEAVKMTLALGFQAYVCCTSNLGLLGGLQAFRSLVFYELRDRKRMVSIWAPSIAYAIQNNLFYVALGRLSVVEYQIGMQLRVLWVALASTYFLGHKYTRRQWAMLVLLIGGVVLVQVGDVRNQPMEVLGKHGIKRKTSRFPLLHMLLGWAAMLVGSGASSCSGVLLEWFGGGRGKANSGAAARKAPMWMQAAQVSFYTLLFSLVPLALTFLWNQASHDANNPNSSLRSKLNWLNAAIVTGQSLGGLLVAYTITSIGNLERMFATSLGIVCGFVGERLAFPKPPTTFSSVPNISWWSGDGLVLLGIVAVLYAIWAFQPRPGEPHYASSLSASPQKHQQISLMSGLDNKGSNLSMFLGGSSTEDASNASYLPLAEIV